MAWFGKHTAPDQKLGYTPVAPDTATSATGAHRGRLAPAPLASNPPPNTNLLASTAATAALDAARKQKKKAAGGGDTLLTAPAVGVQGTAAPKSLLGA